jgi:hypothetical protein
MKCLHDYKIINETKDALVEYCKLCRSKKVYKKDKKGNVNNKEYLKDHTRQFAQPHGKTGKDFKRLYGEAKDLAKENKDLVDSTKEVANIKYEHESWVAKRLDQHKSIK